MTDTTTAAPGDDLDVGLARAQLVAALLGVPGARWDLAEHWIGLTPDLWEQRRRYPKIVLHDREGVHVHADLVSATAGVHVHDDAHVAARRVSSDARLPREYVDLQLGASCVHFASVEQALVVAVQLLGACGVQVALADSAGDVDRTPAAVAS